MTENSEAMFDPQIRSWILTLDATRGVHFIRALLLAEASRLGVDLGVVRMTGIVLAGDEGVDGRTDFPAEAVTVFPKGPWSWQIKVYGKGRRPSASEEVRKPGVQNDINAGRGFSSCSRSALGCPAIDRAVAQASNLARGRLWPIEKLVGPSQLSGREIVEESVERDRLRIGPQAVTVVEGVLPSGAEVPCHAPSADDDIPSAVGNAEFAEVEVADHPPVLKQNVGKAVVAVADDHVLGLRREGLQAFQRLRHTQVGVLGVQVVSADPPSGDPLVDVR